MSSEDVIHFWFTELSPKKWWVKDPETDALIKGRFMQVFLAAGAGELFHWRGTAFGRLAEIIVLDQFPRNIFRDTAEAFASDGIALILAQEAVRTGADQQLSIRQRPFCYMPYMHSESLTIHDQAVDLFSQPGMESNLEFEQKHRAIIEKFGRYPHRNTILGRQSTPEEIQFLQKPGSSF